MLKSMLSTTEIPSHLKAAALNLLGNIRLFLKKQSEAAPSFNEAANTNPYAFSAYVSLCKLGWLSEILLCNLV